MDDLSFPKMQGLVSEWVRYHTQMGSLFLEGGLDPIPII